MIKGKQKAGDRQVRSDGTISWLSKEIIAYE